MRRFHSDPPPLLDENDSFEALGDECLDRVRSIATRSDRSLEGDLQALLRFGAAQLGTERGFLTNINPGLGTHEIAVRSHPSPTLFPERTRKLSTTYCRSVLASGEPVRVHDAEAQDRAHDPAYQAFGLRCYIGAKVVVNDQLYGTVCFVGQSPREAPFGEADVDLVSLIAQWVGWGLKSRGGEQFGLPSRATLRADRDLLRRVQRVAQVGGWEMDLETGTLTWTTEVYRIHDLPLDYDPSVEKALQFYAPEARPQLRAALDRCLDDGRSFDLELPLDTAEGHRRWVRTRGDVVPDANGMPLTIIGTLQDVTEQRELRSQLRAQRDLLNSINENVSEGIFRTTPEDGIVYANQALADLFGYDTVEELDAADPETLYAIPARRDEFWTEAETLEQSTRDVLFRRKDGSTFPGRVSGTITHGDDGQIQHIDGVVTDLTDEHRRWEHLLDVQEQERRRVDQEMHDEMAGLLSSLQMMVELAEMEAESAGVTIEPLDTIKELTSELGTVSQTISRRLHPDTLTEEGLVAALQSMHNRMQELHDLTIRLHCEEGLEEGALSSLMKKAAFQVAQESLLKIIWHAEPEAARVDVHRSDDALHIRVADDGTGSDLSAQSGTLTSLLDAVRDRVQRLGGTLSVDASADDGARITTRLPFDLSSFPGRAWRPSSASG